MILQPLSKSKYEVFLKCPWKAHALKNLGLEDSWGQPAADGIETHDLLEGVLSERISEPMALEMASSDEVRSLFAKGVMLSPVVDKERALFENRVSIDKKGNITTDAKKSIAHGILDIVEPIPSKEIVVVSDWKTGKYQKDNIFERHLYGGMLAHAMFPEYSTVHFNLIFVRSGDVLHSEYKFSKKDKELLITSPSGKTEFLCDNKSPLLAWLEAIIRKIRTTPARPNPGQHCVKWYGTPCVFHGAECPLSQRLPATTHEILPDYKEYKEAFFAMRDHSDIINSADTAARAYFAATQLENAAKVVKQNAAQWTDRNGPFQIGDTMYGWHESDVNTVDTGFVIQTMLDSGMSVEEIGRVASISKTSIERLPIKYNELKALLLGLGVSKESKRKFGPVKMKGEIK